MTTWILASLVCVCVFLYGLYLTRSKDAGQS